MNVGAAAGTRVVVGMSGGVDSAVAALRLREAGCEVHGLYMSNWDDQDAYCSNAQDYQDARLAARELGIVLHRVSFEPEYRQRVFAEFLDEYRRGRTPNPDVLCNREIKFGVCLHYARRLGARWFATGHYAQLGQDPAGPMLLRGADAHKDQSYFLCGVGRARFAQVLFPVGSLSKAEVRAQAQRAGLPLFNKPDSTGICFIGERPFAEFLAAYLPLQPGPIETADGRRLGTHRGLHFYTLGQRGGLEIGGVRGASGDPWYVARKDPGRNALIVVAARERAAAATAALRTGAVNWLVRPPTAPIDAAVKIRYRQPDQAARIAPLADGGARVEFESPQWAVTPGQTAALYAGARCLGGGVIEETL
ncbi:MAG: tRNA 2-thiouridine(34) synthase MnmA [Gammaproteobacteria bacterium]|nr:tRNA 2-thiouridine(34) synthase MnmA [Gammaproteobacteria bacterium]MDE2251990.1 tRNA 2-thiouridine(34) synthase MnmA [Gammaproteobacteria bacterium]